MCSFASFSEISNSEFGEEHQIVGWVRSRRRGSRKLLFVDVNLESLMSNNVEENVLNDQNDLYYKYKTHFTPSENTITLVLFSEDGYINIRESNENFSCDQLRKMLTVGSKIKCTAYKDKKEFYEISPPWFKEHDPHKKLPSSILMKVSCIHIIDSSKPKITTEEIKKKPKNETKNESIIDSDDIHCNEKAHKKERTKIFVDWLINTFGRDYLNSGTGVIDVAGGKGAISWELQCVRSIKCTLVDPRSVHLSGRQKKYLRKFHKDSFSQLQLALRNPKLDEPLICEFGMDNLFKDCSLIIGMHPDEATDCIVDYSVYYKKPFAIVPCCVYSELFSQRKIGDDTVASYEQLLDFLQYEKTDKVEKLILPFHGRNIVLFKQI